MPDPAFRRRRPRHFDDDEPVFAKRDRHRRSLISLDAFDAADGLAEGDRWSTWDQSTAGERGPRPYPDWLVTDLAAVDTELGILKTGKEADVFLVRRGVPGGGPSCLLAAKRYRDSGHRMFHRDSGYLEGRRIRASRDSRAMARRTDAGRVMIAAQRAGVEFAALSRLYQAGVPVPYPVQVVGTEVVLEFVGEPDGTAAPRLADLRRAGATWPACGSSWWRPWSRWPGMAWPTATCPPTTCWCTAADWSSSTCRRSWTSSPTRVARSTWTGTPGTWPPGSPRGA